MAQDRRQAGAERFTAHQKVAPSGIRSSFRNRYRGVAVRVSGEVDHPLESAQTGIVDAKANEFSDLYVIRASAAVQAQLDSELPLIVHEHVGPAATVTVPVICQVWRSARR